MSLSRSRTNFHCSRWLSITASISSFDLPMAFTCMFVHNCSSLSEKFHFQYLFECKPLRIKSYFSGIWFAYSARLVNCGHGAFFCGNVSIHLVTESVALPAIRTFRLVTQKCLSRIILNTVIPVQHSRESAQRPLMQTYFCKGECRWERTTH